MKKILGFLMATVFILLLVFLVDYHFIAKFEAGSCIKAQDGYIWHINRYGSGNYSVMGWQDPWWGLEVAVKKQVLERNTSLGIPEYRQIDCPKPIISY